MANCLIDEKAPLFTLDALYKDGEIAPFSLQKCFDEERWTILMFYPKNFTKICPTEITLVSDRIDEFEEADTTVVGISMDSIPSHKSWVSTPRHSNGVGKIDFPLLADVSGEACKLYGVFNEKNQLPYRALFIINPDGAVQYVSVFHNNVGRDVDEILRVLHALQTGGFCPANWKPGSEIIF